MNRRNLTITQSLLSLTPSSNQLIKSPTVHRIKYFLKTLPQTAKHRVKLSPKSNSHSAAWDNTKPTITPTITDI